MPNIAPYLPVSVENNWLMFVVMSAVIITLVIDTSVVKIYYFSLDSTPLGWRISVFLAISCISTGGLVILSKFAKLRGVEYRAKKSRGIKALQTIVTVSLYALILLIGLVVIQIILTSSYDIIFLILSTWICYSTAVIVMVTLASSFFSWYILNKYLVVLVYGLSSAALAINAMFTIVFNTLVLVNTPTPVVPHVAVGFPFFSAGPATEVVNYGYVITSIVSFMLWWIATVLVLHHYSKGSKRIRIWIALVIPLIYFLLQFQPLFLNFFASFLNSDPVLFSTVYTLVFTLSKPIGGFLFGIAFWSIARKLTYNSTVRNYMIASAYGLVLVFVSNQAAVLSSAPYPPFGLATTCFMGLATYLVFVGIYSSALSVSEDSELRQSIRDLAEKESRLLDKIGTAEMAQHIQRKVIDITKRNQDRMAEERGVISSITEEDMKEYLEEVIKEIETNRGRS